MRWKDDFKQEFDLIYKIVKDEYSDIKYPCYGGRFYWFLVSRYFEELYFYLTQSSLIYTSGGYISKIPFSKIRKLSVKQGLLVKSSFHVRIVADNFSAVRVSRAKNVFGYLSMGVHKNFLEARELRVFVIAFFYRIYASVSRCLVLAD